MAALALAVLACSTAPAAPASTPAAALHGGPEFSAIMASSDLAVGPNRVAFGLLDRDHLPVRTPQAQVQAFYVPLGETEGQLKQTATAEFLQWPPPGQRGVYVTTLDFDTPGDGSTAYPGVWALHITTTATDGTPIEAQTFVAVREESYTPPVGAPAPRSATPTAREVSDLSHISSARPPDPDLYRLSIDEALDQGKPLVVVFATPAFCVSATCGPQVEMVSQVKERHQEAANFVHVEVYQDPHLIQGAPSVEGLAPSVQEWGLRSEPWTFIIDREGRVHAKFEQFTPAEEIERALLEVL